MDKNDDLKFDISLGDINIDLGSITIPKVNKFPKDNIEAIGLFEVTKSDLNALKLENRKVSIKVNGILKISKDVTKELITATISKLTVVGVIYATKEVKEVIKNI